MNRERLHYYKRWWYHTPENTYDFICVVCKSFIATFNPVPKNLTCEFCMKKENDSI